jgi:hypothetical protein
VCQDPIPQLAGLHITAEHLAQMQRLGSVLI